MLTSKYVNNVHCQLQIIHYDLMKQLGPHFVTGNYHF